MFCPIKVVVAAPNPPENACAIELTEEAAELPAIASAPKEFMARYKLTSDEVEGLDSYDLFELVGRKRGFLISGGEINHKRCSDMLLDEFRGGKIGRITLEVPGER